MTDDPVLALRDLLATTWVPHALLAAAQLCIADELAARPRTAADLAATIDADAGMVGRLLRALATIGVVRCDGGCYSLTEIGALLRADTPASMRRRVLLQAGAGAQRSWGQLDLHMLVANGGSERTEAEYAALFAAADLRLTSITPTRTVAALDVIEAVPA